MTRHYDVVIVGGGPAGSALAALLARAGHEVALFERRAFPRFHVGESLIPVVNLTLQKLGVRDAMDARGFPRKHGVQFFTRGTAGRPFYFSEVDDPRMHHTWQVLRGDFDAMLLDNAAQAGAFTATETEVLEARTENGEAGVLVRNHDGSRELVRARVVVDASGQRGLIARRFGGHDHFDGLANASVFAHYRGAVRDPGIDAGSTLVFRTNSRSWLWFIPLPEVVSVGLVAPARDIWSLGGTANQVLENAIAGCEPLRERLAAAQRTTEVHAVRDYSYRAVRDGGAGWLLVGDALGFIDPIYSTGLFLSMRSAELAEAAITAALGGDRRLDFAGYSEEYQVAFDKLLLLVRAFYTDDFHFGELARRPEHRRGLIDLLTGLVSTPRADAVADLLRAWFEDRTST